MTYHQIISKNSRFSRGRDQRKTKFTREAVKHTLFNPLSNSSYQKSDFAATELDGNTRNGTIKFPNGRTQVIQGHAGLFSNLHDMTILSNSNSAK